MVVPTFSLIPTTAASSDGASVIMNEEARRMKDYREKGNGQNPGNNGDIAISVGNGWINGSGVVSALNEAAGKTLSKDAIASLGELEGMFTVPVEGSDGVVREYPRADLLNILLGIAIGKEKVKKFLESNPSLQYVFDPNAIPSKDSSELAPVYENLRNLGIPQAVAMLNDIAEKLNEGKTVGEVSKNLNPENYDSVGIDDMQSIFGNIFQYNPEAASSMVSTVLGHMATSLLSGGNAGGQIVYDVLQHLDAFVNPDNPLVKLALNTYVGYGVKKDGNGVSLSFTFSKSDPSKPGIADAVEAMKMSGKFYDGKYLLHLEILNSKGSRVGDAVVYVRYVAPNDGGFGMPYEISISSSPEVLRYLIANMSDESFVRNILWQVGEMYRIAKEDGTIPQNVGLVNVHTLLNGLFGNTELLAPVIVTNIKPHSDAMLEMIEQAMGNNVAEKPGSDKRGKAANGGSDAGDNGIYDVWDGRREYGSMNEPMEGKPYNADASNPGVSNKPGQSKADDGEAISFVYRPGDVLWDDGEEMAKKLANRGVIPPELVPQYTDAFKDIGMFYAGMKPGDVQSPPVGFEITYKGKAPEGTVVEYGGNEIDVSGRLAFEITGPSGTWVAYAGAVDRDGNLAGPSNFYDVRYVTVPGQ